MLCENYHAFKVYSFVLIPFYELFQPIGSEMVKRFPQWAMGQATALYKFCK